MAADMASSKLVDAARRGQVEDRARRRLGIAPRELTELAVYGGNAAQRATLLARLRPRL